MNQIVGGGDLVPTSKLSAFDNLSLSHARVLAELHNSIRVRVGFALFMCALMSVVVELIDFGGVGWR